MDFSQHRWIERATRRIDPAQPRRALSAALLGLVVACGGGSSTDPGNGLSSGDPTTWSCSGADVSTLTSLVHVSTQGTDDAGCGAATQTCLTIQQGIARCAQAGCAVLVRHGLYVYPSPQSTTQSTIVLLDGVSVYGGCRFGDEPDRGYRTTIQASPKIGEPAISASGVATPTRIHRLVVVAADRGVGEGASIAMHATSSPGLTLTRTVLASGRGGDGAIGATGSTGPGERGGDGQVTEPGAGGGRACAAAPPSDSRGKGGQGGDGLMGSVDATNHCYRAYKECDCGYVNPTQSIGRMGLASASIAGGAGGHQHSLGGWVCTKPASPERFRGADGGPGNPGACATQGGPTSPDLWGSVAAQGWQAGAGGSGADGDVGSGGGGGTSGGFCLKWDVIQFVQGVAAGGGGGGGCGGGGGAGGKQGGASIALLIAAASVELEPQGVVLLPGPGGDGGTGGPANGGGEGGTGGAGAPSGGTDVFGYNCPGPSGRGGLGGAGGNGAGGAGGNGGPSINLALAASATQPTGADVGTYGGTPGLGGDVGRGVGTSLCTTPGGALGVGGGAATVINFDKPPSNVLSVGQTLHGATNDSRYSPSGRYRLTMQDDGNLCLYDSGVYRWCSIQDEKWLHSAYLSMQTDGNLCLYDENRRNPSCSEATLGHRGAYLSVDNDGHVVVREGSLVLWSRPKAPS